MLVGLVSIVLGAPSLDRAQTILTASNDCVDAEPSMVQLATTQMAAHLGKPALKDVDSCTKVSQAGLCNLKVNELLAADYCPMACNGNCAQQRRGAQSDTDLMESRKHRHNPHGHSPHSHSPHSHSPHTHSPHTHSPNPFAPPPSPPSTPPPKPPGLPLTGATDINHQDNQVLACTGYIERTATGSGILNVPIASSVGFPTTTLPADDAPTDDPKSCIAKCDELTGCKSFMLCAAHKLCLYHTMEVTATTEASTDPMYDTLKCKTFYQAPCSSISPPPASPPAFPPGQIICPYMKAYTSEVARGTISNVGVIDDDTEFTKEGIDIAGWATINSTFSNIFAHIHWPLKVFHMNCFDQPNLPGVCNEHEESMAEHGFSSGVSDPYFNQTAFDIFLSFAVDGKFTETEIVAAGTYFESFAHEAIANQQFTGEEASNANAGEQHAAAIHLSNGPIISWKNLLWVFGRCGFRAERTFGGVTIPTHYDEASWTADCPQGTMTKSFMTVDDMKKIYLDSEFPTGWTTFVTTPAGVHTGIPQNGAGPDSFVPVPPSVKH